MIRMPPATAGLTAAERYGLEMLVDLARLVPVEDPSLTVTVLDLGDEPGPCADLAGCLAHRWGIVAGQGVVHIPRAALRMVADLAGAGAEQRSVARDKHGRVPSSENPLVALGLERDPVVSRAAVLLRQAVIAAAGPLPVRLVPPWPARRRWAVALTHDLDAVEWWPMFTALRLVELARKGEWRLAGAVLGSAGRAVGGDPLGANVKRVLEEEASAGVVATWFVLCGTPSFKTMAAGDLTYRPEAKATRRILAAITQQGHEIGLHGSFETVDRAGAFEAQRARLAGLTGRPVAGVRQHFVRMRPGETQQAMVRAGFGYDATYGFPDRNGFRLGVADIVPGWDVRESRSSGLEEVPLIWMDRAQSKYQGIEAPDQWIDEAIELAKICREVEGLWVGIWHPNLAPPLGFPDAPPALTRLITELRAMQPHVATVSELIRWRSARRQVRITARGTDGTFSAAGPALTLTEPVYLEDASGRRAEQVAWDG